MDNLKVDIYVHVVHRGNPRGSGKAVAVIEYVTPKGKVYTKEVITVCENETKNALTLQAVTDAVKALIKPCDITVHIDNGYIENCIKQGWLEQWKKNGWKKATNTPPANVELWKRLVICKAMHKMHFAGYESREEFKEVKKYKNG